LRNSSTHTTELALHLITTELPRNDLWWNGPSWLNVA